MRAALLSPTLTKYLPLLKLTVQLLRASFLLGVFLPKSQMAVDEGRTLRVCGAAGPWGSWRMWLYLEEAALSPQLVTCDKIDSQNCS